MIFEFFNFMEALATYITTVFETVNMVPYN